MKANAKARYIRISPRKARRVVDLIRGLPVVEARRILAFSNLGAAKQVGKVLNSAVANAEQNAGVVADNLVVRAPSWTRARRSSAGDLVRSGGRRPSGSTPAT